MENFAPKSDSQPIPYHVFKSSVPNEGKWEYNRGRLLWSDSELHSCILMLVGTIGLRRFVEILPQESRNELERILMRRSESEER